MRNNTYGKMYKSEEYFTKLNMNIINSISGFNNNVLDVGCGFALTGKALRKAGIAKYVVGIEADAAAAEEAKKNIDKVICCDASDTQLELEDSFDYVILSHILEHLYNPGSLLKTLLKNLKPEGKIIAGLPNIRYWRILRDLILYDKWEYCEAGILDYDHVRFFTMKSAEQLFYEAEYDIIKKWYCVHGKKQGFANIVTGGVLEGFFGSELYVLAKKRGSQSH
jgi:2-polyprenyl-3-methyl-5-hydroxy-6-metoxy-1,4-benzoquinol methylase